MPIEQWGATGTLGLTWPDSPIGILLLGIFAVILVIIIFFYRVTLRRMSWRQWGFTAVLSLLSFVVSQLFPIHLSFENQLSPLSVAQNPVTTLTLLAAAPYLLAGVSLNPAAALIVGLFSGLGRSIGQSHYPFDIFIFAMAAVLASIWMQQVYQGRFYRWLRQPVVAGALTTLGLVVAIGAASFASSEASASSLAAVDLALSTAQANFVPLLIEGVVGGLLVSLILLGLPQLKPARKLRPSPAQLSLRRRLLNNFTLFAVILTLLLLIVASNLSINVSTRLVVNQMAHDAKTVSAVIPEFQAQLENVLGQFSRYENALGQDPAERERALEQLYELNPFLFRRFVLVDEEQRVIAYYPPDQDEVALTEQEKTAVVNTWRTNVPDMTSAKVSNGDHVFSLVAPVRNDQGEPTAVLIGRVPQLSLDNLIVGLQGTVGQGSGFIVDEDGQIIAHADPGRLASQWDPPETIQSIPAEEAAPGFAYQGRQGQTNARELVYYIESENHPWTVVTVVPYDVVLRLALSIGGPLTLVLMLVMAAFYTNLAVIGRDITNPITQLVQASKSIAAGEKWTPPDQAQRDDEIGQLNQAFFQMYQSRNKRLNELSLLLGVSHEVSASVDISRGMAAILRGALRGTGAVGARAVVLNPSGGYPLQYGEGPMSRRMSSVDRQIMSRLRHQPNLLLSTAEEIRQALDLPETAVLPVSAILAIPLHSHDRFQGILWLGYRQPHSFDQTEHNLLRTLSGQAAVLVENARLYATAEGGRRRLAAVLASTSDAVIVTDQTNRILLVNRAMEQVFDLKAKQVIGRSLADVIEVKELISALSGDGERTRNLEIPIANGKTFYASASAILNNDGQEMGRVAVLHDITYLKEIDEMKSDFVRTVSHDLRNPLTFMRGYATMLSMVGEVNEDQQKYIDKIHNGIEQMQQLVNNLLDLGRIEAGIDLHREEIEVDALLDDIATEHWQHAHLRGLKINVEVPPDAPPIVGDKLLIRQAITNLLTNGIKYAPDTGWLRLKAEPVNGEMVFSVQDNGPGIPKQDQLRLFEKFYRVQQKNQEKVKGIGLGLAIVKSIAERHGGRAWCHSRQGRGSIFYISIPLRPPNQNGDLTSNQ